MSLRRAIIVVFVFWSGLAAAETPIVDQFHCTIQITDGKNQTTSTNAKLSAVRRVRVNPQEQMLYETPGQDLVATLSLPSGVNVQLWAQYTFKRPLNRPDSWGLHTCLSGSVTDASGHTSHWACPEFYFPVSQSEDVPQFEGAFGKYLEHNFKLDGYEVRLSCTQDQTIY